MDFGEYKSSYNIFYKQRPDLNFGSYYLQGMEQAILKHNKDGGDRERVDTDLMTMAAEWTWHSADQVYYQVWPDYIDILSQIKLSIPGNEFRLPFSAFAIHLPDGCIKLWGKYVTSFLVADANAARQVVAKNIKETVLRFEPSQQHQRAGFTEDKTECLSMLLRNDTGQVMDTYLVYGNHLTLQDSLKLTREFDEINSEAATSAQREAAASSKEVYFQLFSIAVAVACLGVGRDDIIQPMILRRDQDRYAKAVQQRDEAKQKHLRNRASKRHGGRRGYTIGRGSRISLLPRRRFDSATSDEAERELHHQHQRCGHFHGYHTKDGYKLKWINQLTVRPDLPLDPRRRGYEIRS